MRPSGANGSLWRRLGLVPRATLGMMLAHIGVAAFIFGVTMVRTHEIERDVTMRVGDSTTVKGYTFTYKGTQEVTGPNYRGLRGHLTVTQEGKDTLDLHPEKRVYKVQRNPMTEAAIDAGFTRDLYVALGEVVQGDAWIVRIWIKPFIDWIWGGTVLMGLGGLLAVSDRRYRARVASAAPETLSAARGANA